MALLASRRVVLAGALASALLASSTARADGEPPPLDWKWEPFRAWEYPATAAALGGATAIRIVAPAPSANWTGGILFDDWVQDHTAMQSISGRQSVMTMTDVFFYGSMGYRLLDSAILPSLVWRSPDAAFQMSMIDLESFGLVAITLWGGQALFGRERPFAHRCGNPAFAATEACAPDASEHNRSFYAGHPATVLTAAGLTCTHHAHLPLYGGGWPDKLACVLMLSAAAATGVGRLVSEEHHASDILIGYGVGVVAGFVMPEFLHYRHLKPGPDVAPDPRPATLIHATLVPQLGTDQVGVGLRGTF